MTKKHFIALANELRKLEPIEGSHHGRGLPHTEKCFHTCHSSWRMTVRAMAGFCATQNAQFDRSRFLVACGVAQ